MQEHVWLSQYEAGVPRTIEFQEASVVEFLENTVAKFPDNPALVFLNAQLSYRELWDQVRRMATALAELGAQPGVGVAIHLPNMPQTVIAYYGALMTGARVVLTNPLYTPTELEHQWTDAGIEIAITADFLYDQKVRALRPKLPTKHFIIASVPEYLRFPLNLLAPFKLKKQSPPLIAKIAPEPGVHFFRKLVKSTAPDPPAVKLNLDDVAVLQYTGGTTGLSKGAMLTHRNLSVNVQQVNSWFVDVEYGKEVIMTALPLFHVFGMTVCQNWSVFSGAKQVLLPNPRDIPAVVKAIVKHRVTCFPAVPAMFNAMNNFPGIEGYDLSSIKSCFSGSAPLAEDVMKRFEALTSSTIIEGFGMSETSPVTHVNPLTGQRKTNSVGIPVPNTEARVVSPEGGHEELPIGEEGELIVRGPQVMLGYWKREKESAEALQDGWLHTGDLATMDEDGYFFIVGRIKDMINCGGLKVYPDEVDRWLQAHDKILEAATIGVPDEKRGETVKSFIVLQPGASLTADEVETYCREGLAAYKIPRQVEFLDELPKSTVMKVLRRELRERELKKQKG